MIQRCFPLCRSCICRYKDDCTQWIIEQNSQDRDCKKGFIFDIEQQKYLLCPVGCQKCSDQETCLKLRGSIQIKGTQLLLFEWIR
ncbi:unnamed protein product (macronuclear) [Paramecium tetraurelia]|uniref:ShKT domain-containing protein n=1 Tax=Paramecium tetraurelia TaxID=5888 RepID=A0DDH9_PARTE|nr:uncharacterized protein GSPATT00015956001 [Paramecium tetraurelia]CAK81096.1 unnamed protein product [Paramecium tetraurelia]|eukprot:XP_001448493.1 hypothetical protein (macronuclear) [Paramecium tetraurelia strain d4-2]